MSLARSFGSSEPPSAATQTHDIIAEIGERPSWEYTIDRYPNPRGNYEPGNVRWATDKEHAHNKAGTTIVTVDGVTDSVSRIADRVGIRNRLAEENDPEPGDRAKGGLFPVLPLPFGEVHVISEYPPSAHYVWPAFTVSPFPIISKPVHHSSFQARLGEICHKISTATA